MNDKNGFTLIELLVTVALIAAVVIASGIGINEIFIRENARRATEYINKIQEAACLYAAVFEKDNEKLTITSNGANKSANVKVMDLITNGYLSKDLVNPITNKKIISTTEVNNTVLINWNSNGLKTCVYNT